MVEQPEHDRYAVLNVDEIPHLPAVRITGVV